MWSGHNSPASRVWVSHLDDDEMVAVVRSVTDIDLRPRIGTRLWLGERSALRAAGTVLAVHPVPVGTHVGYRQRTGPKDGTLIVVSGGTAHGIGLSAPTPAASVRQRVVTAGTGDQRQQRGSQRHQPQPCSSHGGEPRPVRRSFAMPPTLQE